MTATLDTRAPVSRYQLLERALTEVGHPVRLQVLERIAAGPASPKDIAAASDATLGTVAYHVRWMAAEQLITLTDERRVRGSVEHIYRLTSKGRRLHQALLGEDGPDGR